ncbi:MAG: hypothetical protein QOG11_1128, partial [Solirubrobacteraceae bacterium]|nr:hypothetical protein [Solirubrobacteraceae bacterium]
MAAPSSPSTMRPIDQATQEGDTMRARRDTWTRGRQSGVTALGVAAAIGGGLLAAGPAQAGQSAFSDAGDHPFTVPQGVTQLHVVAVGAAGGGSVSRPGGYGAKVTADVTVTPGQALHAFVGGPGGTAGTDKLPANASSGAGAGGAGGLGSMTFGGPGGWGLLSAPFSAAAGG